MTEGITIKTKQVTINQGAGTSPAAKARWDGETVAGLLVKAEEERRFTLAVAYPADKADVGVALDGHRDFASKQAVENAAWNYMLKSRQVSLFHAEGTDGAGNVVESYIYRGPDWAIKAADGTEVTVKAGDWLMGVQWSEKAWPLVKEGHVRGLSPEGRATRRKASPEAVASLRS